MPERDEGGKAREALERMKQSNDAIEQIVAVLAKLPDPQMRWSVIDYLYRQLAIDREASHA